MIKRALALNNTHSMSLLRTLVQTDKIATKTANSVCSKPSSLVWWILSRPIQETRFVPSSAQYLTNRRVFQSFLIRFYILLRHGAPVIEGNATSNIAFLCRYKSSERRHGHRTTIASVLDPQLLPAMWRRLVRSAVDPQKRLTEG